MFTRAQTPGRRRRSDGFLRTAADGLPPQGGSPRAEAGLCCPLVDTPLTVGRTL